ncbi:hypothetical protein JKP88DRAFT_217970 [Tribonema minus]|uniref:Secreted protein n=1 Tax=Tribonema minus TaxID=303371 RepID=A0A835ZBH2_9STRA|nr:hypothetical protein JKP88DRAFT_217970 [Tribonema minus]
MSWSWALNLSISCRLARAAAVLGCQCAGLQVYTCGRRQLTCRAPFSQHAVTAQRQRCTSCNSRRALVAVLSARWRRLHRSADCAAAIPDSVLSVHWLTDPVFLCPALCMEVVESCALHAACIAA